MMIPEDELHLFDLIYISIWLRLYMPWAFNPYDN